MTLKELFTNIANAIRSATGTTGKIKASDFATKINAIKYRGVAVEGTDSGQNSQGVYYHIPKGYYEEVGTNYSWVYRPLSDFGNAKPSDVLSGKTFTSSSGKEVKGTLTKNNGYTFVANIYGDTNSYTKYCQVNDLIIFASRGDANNISCTNATEVYKNKTYETTICVWRANSTYVVITNNNSGTSLWANGCIVRPN